MDSFSERVAVVSGGGSGIGRALVLQLAAEGCHVATCDIRGEAAESTAAAAADLPGRVTAHTCDVADERQWQAFRTEALEQHGTDHVHLLVNNAGLGGGNSFIVSARDEWERTFDICWRSTYLGCRTFLPDVIDAPEGHVVNVSSVNGFWAATVGQPNSAYSSAKFAVKGFTEALIDDLRMHAPHVGVTLVMPGHIGTDFIANTIRVHTHGAAEEMAERYGAGFRDAAPMSPDQAATVILDAVREGRWRVLVGDDAHEFDQAIRTDPDRTYDQAWLFSQITRLRDV